MRAAGRWRILWLFVVVALNGCHPSKSSSGDNHPKFHAFAAQGVIEKIAPDRRQVTIHHDTIAGYMMEMTMDFPVKDSADLRGLSPGDRIGFTLVVEQDQDWVKDFHRLGHISLTPDMQADFNPAAALKPGDPLPNGELMAEDGHPIRLSDFRGKAVALTFFFTRCPLPNYCPLLNQNFARTRSLLLADPKAPANWQFLSISFDSDFDQPATLSADRWLFAAAPPAALAQLAPALGLVIMRQGPSISHNIRTVVIDPRGRLYRRFNDNLWTPRQLADALSDASCLSK
jgi:protein SCO1/2